MIDGNESEGVTGILDYPSDEAEPPKHHLNDEVSVGSGVLDLDVLSEENEEEEIKIHGMKADEFYAYIYILIMIFYVYDVEMKSRGGNMKNQEVWNFERTERSRIFSGALHAGGINDGTSTMAHTETPCNTDTETETEIEIEKGIENDLDRQEQKTRFLCLAVWWLTAKNKKHDFCVLVENQ